MGMDAVDFDIMERKSYKIEGNKYSLKYPYISLRNKFLKAYSELQEVFTDPEAMQLVQKITGQNESIALSNLLMKLISTSEGTALIDKISKIQVKVLQMLLDGDTNKITVSNLRQDVFDRVVSDFFSSFSQSN